MAKYGRCKYGQAKYGEFDPMWVTVRTQTDLEKGTNYAYINYTDLNRIETRTKEIGDRLNEMGITNTITTNIWQEQTEGNFDDNLPTLDKMQNLLDNINKMYELIKSNFNDFVLTNNVPKSMRYLNIHSVNGIEGALYEMYLFLEGAI